MRRFCVGTAVLIGLLASLSCSHQSPPSKPPATTRAWPADIRIYYREKMLKPLDVHELTALRQRIDDAKIDRREIWFVDIDSFDNRTISTIYMRPADKSARLLRGIRVSFPDQKRIDEWNRKIAPKLGEPQWAPKPYPYAVLLKAGGAWDKSFTPVESESPFSPPDWLSDDEIAKLLDAVWSAAGASPVVRIFREGEEIVVHLGFQNGGLSGGGDSVRLRRMGSGFVVLTTGYWVS